MRLNITVFDPAAPSTTHEAITRIETGRTQSCITSELMSHFPGLRQTTLRVPFQSYDADSFEVEAKCVEIGVRLGGFQTTVRAIVVEKGESKYGTPSAGTGLRLSGTDFERLLDALPDDSVRVLHQARLLQPVDEAAKHDEDALALQLFPVGNDKLYLSDFQIFLRSVQQLHNIFVIAENAIAVRGANDVDELVDSERGLPEGSRLTVEWIEYGSVWITLKSAFKSALQRLSSLFKREAEARASRALAEARKADVEAVVLELSSEQAIQKAQAEQLALVAKSRREAYDEYRNNILGAASTLDELLARVESDAARERMKQIKDAALLAMAERLVYPVLQNSPDASPALRDALPHDSGERL